MRLGTALPARSTTRSTRARLGAAALGVTLALGATACSGEDEPSDPDATAQATETAEPGPEVEAETATFQAPSGFELGEPSKKSPAVIATGPSGALVSLVEIEFPGEAPEIDRQQEIALDGLGEKFAAEDVVEVDGIEMWHVSGKESKGNYADVYGAVVDGTSVRLTIRLADAEYDEAERAAVNEQVLASWSWA
ncbi:hypothetical protein [Nocardioides sp.]|uniref:hypothetical protein n=1 Tax=Nocardioides sp. TaxID=35761 RepID=UPI00263959D1|nr:hypothetical protein [Nocardioides sp.]